MSPPKDHRFRRRVTAWDVARAAGVNQSVVSRAFNAGSRVAPETRERLLAIAKELGYAPNALARGLLTGRTRLIGITTVQINSEISSRLLQNLGLGLLSVDLHPLLLPLSPQGVLADEIHRLFTFDVDALVLVSAAISPALVEACTAWGRPVILLNRVAPGHRLHSIRTDDYGGGRLAAQHLLERGAQSLAFVSGPANATNVQARRDGFFAAAEAAGQPPPRIVAGDFAYPSGVVAGRTLLGGPGRPDAVFCANDVMALGLMDVARELGIRIPGDLQVVGFDDITAASFAGYSLTTLRHDLDIVAAETVALLADLQRDGEASLVDRVVSARLIDRRSTHDL